MLPTIRALAWLLGTLPLWAAAGEEPGFLRLLAATQPNGVVVVHGSDPGSQEAADLIAQRIRRLPGLAGWKGLMSDRAFDAADRTVTGQVHIIAVGSLADNLVLQNRGWLPTWWLDRGWYYQKYPFAVQPADALPYQPTSGFVAAGFGEWPKEERRVGYIEVDRSDYMMEWIVRGRWDRQAGSAVSDNPNAGEEKHAWRKLPEVQGPTYPTDFPLRLVVRITGTGPDGIKAAARAFAEDGMLSGVVLGTGAKADAGPALFTLSPARYLAALPFAPPAPPSGWTYAGWLEADAFLYDGLLKDAGVEPERAVRLKYIPPAGMTGFWSTPHRRATSLEIAALRFARPAEAERAWKQLRSGLEALPQYGEGRFGDVRAALVGSVLYIESLPEPAGAELLAACQKIKPW